MRYTWNLLIGRRGKIENGLWLWRRHWFAAWRPLAFTCTADPFLITEEMLEDDLQG